jgi:hypothetical protein
MPDRGFPIYLTTAATALLDIIELVEPSHRAVVMVFDPLDRQHTLYSNAGATDLIPALRLVLERLEAGTLQMPVTGAVRFVDLVEE